MEGENIYDKIQEIFGEVPGTFSILEEKIDIDLQMEYFEFSRHIKKDLDEGAVIKRRDQIFDFARDAGDRKSLFAMLASLEDVSAYRTIEKYLKEGHLELRNWAILALQESRMLLESKLLEENQVFISTGLGGKGSKLRYFVVLIGKEKTGFSDLQKKIIKNEFEDTLAKCDAEIEKVEFLGHFATLVVMVPLKVALKDVFRSAIIECNQYGDFLKSNFIITNVKELNLTEIKDFMKKQQQANPSDDK
ncbi:MAG: hypothetical protein AMS26_13075 [Bacteroides sp. SM23_62]|nr:MAG: hypothetical protein AMS26_13075 [Bacteroides sp. SM23_62]